MRKAISFDIKNSQEEYAKCLRFMQYYNFSKGGELSGDIHVVSIDYDNKIDSYKIACELEEKYSLNEYSNSLKKTENILWYFRINMGQEDDIVNLMYFYLIKQKYNNVVAVLITPNIEYDMKISAYLSFEMKKNRNTVFIKTSSDKIQLYGSVHRLPGASLKERKDVRLTKFLPLIEVTDDTYDFLSGTVEAAQKKMYSRKKDAGTVWENTVLNTCTGLFTQYNRVTSEKFINNVEFTNVISNVTVLTYILFCAFRNHCKDRRKVFEISRIEQELSDARDIAEGILQILENIILHAWNNVGYFSFRIHDSKRSDYLKNEYEEYITDDIATSDAVFLEMFIADCFLRESEVEDESILCKRFMDNLLERSKKDNVFKPFIQEYKNLEVKDFFDNAIWKKYNAVSDNIIEHYGLQLFDKIINSRNGCFEVISTSHYKYKDKQCYYSVKKDKNECRYVIPGTQYKALLPIVEKNNEQEYAGMDFCDYPKTAMLKPVMEEIFIENIDYVERIKEINKRVQNKIQKIGNGKKQRKQLKETLIQEMSKDIYAKLYNEKQYNENCVIHFILDRIKGAGLVEIFFKAYMKALIKFRDLIGNEKKVYVAFGKLTKEFITEFCYLMGIYYYKAEESKLMTNTEMYLWCTDYYEDLLIFGENLHIAHNAIMQRSVLRGIYPYWLNFIDYVWKKYNYSLKIDKAEKIVDRLPYDVIVRDEGKTIFENIVKKVLQRPMADRELGCLIDNTHIQLSSKIHVSRFYNGHVLFLNNYFTNYFSYLIVKKISAAIKEKEDILRSIVFIGYESYSEMLLVETSELLKSYIEKKELNSYYKVLPYIVGEMINKKLVFRSADGCFDKENRLDWQLYKDSQFVFIVPLSSTLSIFEKIQLELEKNLGIVINTQNMIANYALILSRDIYKEKKEENINTDCYMTDVEREYWKEKIGHRIVTKNREIYVDYFIEVCGSWSKASKCQCCFPQKSICEKPLIKTDVTGLSPLTQFGQKKKWKCENSLSRENIKRIKNLSDVLTYNHIERGGNHYLYYFDTVTFFYRNRNQISVWLKSIFIEDGGNKRQYSFIVSPLHGTNVGFTEEVNKILFHNTAHVIRVDFCKTFRSNFMQQFSYLQILYQNIVQSSLRDRWKTEINFYFVDDEVISGKTLIRAKSLIDGLFENYTKKDYITINIFKKIFVLVNRLSDASKHNYIDNTDDYESYVNYNVSTIQNHDDFCFMCKLVDRAKGYKYMSTTNEMDTEWGKIEDKFRVKDYTWAEQNKEYKQDKYKSRMLAAHYSEAAMWNLSENAAPEEYFQVMLTNLFYVRLYKRNGKIVLSENNREVFVSLIKTLSRPFFVYRNNAKEAALHLLIAFSESFLGRYYDDVERELESIISFTKLKIQKEMYSVWQFLFDWGQRTDDSTYNLLLDLLEQLADMESGYIIRLDNVIRVFQLYKKIEDKRFGKDEVLEMKGLQEIIQEKRTARKRFELSYALFIKQITNEDADETKSLWVENLFYFGKELNSESHEKETYFRDHCGYQTTFGRIILVENTKIIYDGIKFLAESIGRNRWNAYQRWILDPEDTSMNIEDEIRQKVVKIAKQALDIQLESFKYILQFYGQESNYDKIGSETLLYGLMFYVNTEGIPFEQFYKKFYSLISEITMAEVQILIIPSKSNMDELLYTDEACIIYDSRTELNLNREIKLKDQPLVDSSYLREIPYELDTYFINAERTQAIIKYSISSKHRDEKDSIYLVLRYEIPQELRRLLFDIRFVLLCRSRTITRMKRDFNNNLFQSLWQTKMHNMLLEHFKNAAHNDPEESDVMRKTINYIWRIEQYCRKEGINPETENGLKIYKALILKMLADNNISSIYHEILAKRLVSNNVCPTYFSVKGIFSDIEDIRYVLVKEKEDYKEWSREKDALPCIRIDKEVFDSEMYYIVPDPFRPHLLLISLILNAYKHGNNRKEIRIYKQEGIYVEKGRIDYLCITNGIYLEEAEIIKYRINQHINKPINSRKLQSDGDKCDGITLFSLNRYCQKVLAGLGETECKNNLVEYNIENDEIVFKVPILKGDI